MRRLTVSRAGAESSSQSRRRSVVASPALSMPCDGLNGSNNWAVYDSTATVRTSSVVGGAASVDYTTTITDGANEARARSALRLASFASSSHHQPTPPLRHTPSRLTGSSLARLVLLFSSSRRSRRRCRDSSQVLRAGVSLPALPRGRLGLDQLLLRSGHGSWEGTNGEAQAARGPEGGEAKKRRSSSIRLVASPKITRQEWLFGHMTTVRNFPWE